MSKLPDSRRSIGKIVRISTTALIAFFSLGIFCPVSGQTSSKEGVNLRKSGEEYWQSAAVTDVAAAYHMLSSDHPGAAPEMHDDEFRQSLAEAHALAARRARQVRSFEGYAATLAGFANSFRDDHLRARPTLRVARPGWAGLVLGIRNGNWTVLDQEPAYQNDLRGLTLVACDGRTVTQVAQERLGGFQIDWSSNAQRAIAAPWLLVDEHNPFLTRPSRCDFRRDGVTKTIDLVWTPTRLDDLLARFAEFKPYGAAGFGVRKAGDGYWIATQSFDVGATQLVEQVRAAADAIRRSPFVILDVRGNGGGSSVFGEQIAAAFMGAPYVAAVSGPSAGCGDSVTRVSIGNRDGYASVRDRFARERGPDAAVAIGAMVTEMDAAMAAGKTFSGRTDCPVNQFTPPAIRSEYAGKVYILTDAYCFSSCLSVTELWRHLGAIQIGQETDSNTHYVDVRDQMMPSGMASFSTMMAVNAGTPMRLGPFVPQLVYPGDISDTAAVQRWAVELASKGAGK